VFRVAGARWQATQGHRQAAWGRRQRWVADSRGPCQLPKPPFERLQRAVDTNPFPPMPGARIELHPPPGHLERLRQSPNTRSIRPPRLGHRSHRHPQRIAVQSPNRRALRPRRDVDPESEAGFLGHGRVRLAGMCRAGAACGRGRLVGSGLAGLLRGTGGVSAKPCPASRLDRGTARPGASLRPGARCGAWQWPSRFRQVAPAHGPRDPRRSVASPRTNGQKKQDRSEWSWASPSGAYEHSEARSASHSVPGSESAAPRDESGPIGHAPSARIPGSRLAPTELQARSSLCRAHAHRSPRRSDAGGSIESSSARVESPCARAHTQTIAPPPAPIVRREVTGHRVGPSRSHDRETAKPKALAEGARRPNQNGACVRRVLACRPDRGGRGRVAESDASWC